MTTALARFLEQNAPNNGLYTVRDLPYMSLNVPIVCWTTLFIVIL